MRKAILLLIALLALIVPGIQASPSVGRSIQDPKQTTKPVDKPAEKDSEKPADNPSESKQKPPFELRITADQIIGISLRAENAKLTDIAADLSKKLKAPVALSPVMQKQRATINFADVVLEPAMQLLAPLVYIDYEIDSAPGAHPRPVGIYLSAHNEPAPAINANVRSTSQAFVISGNTESEDSSEDDDIQISYRNGKLTLKAKDQPLLDVLSSISDETGVRLEAKDVTSETVSVNIKDLPLDEAILKVSPHLRLYLRADLYRNQRTPLLIVLVQPEKKT
jgi:hypothetical protein